MTPTKRDQAIAAAQLVVQMKGDLGYQMVAELLRAAEGEVDTGAKPDSDLANYANEYLRASDATVVTLPDGPVAQYTVVFRRGRRAAVVNVVDVGGKESSRHLSVDVRGFLDDTEHPNRAISWGERVEGNHHENDRDWVFNTVIVGQEVRP